MTNNYAILRAAADQAYGSWKPLTIVELKAYYAIRLLIEITTKGAGINDGQTMDKPWTNDGQLMNGHG